MVRQRLSKLLDQLISAGISGYDASTTRRLRIVNGFALIVAALLLSLLIVRMTQLIVQGQPFLTGAIILVLGAITVLFTLALHRFGRYVGAVYFLVVLIVVSFAGLFLFGLSLRSELGFLVFAAAAPLLFGAHNTLFNFVFGAVMLMLFIFSDMFFPEIGPAISSRSPSAIAIGRQIQTSLYFLLILAMVSYAVGVASKAEKALEAEHARSEALLYNLLPTEIAARLKVEPDKTIADSLPQVAILFADIVNFTPRSSKMAPEDVVNFLNRVFSAFDELAEKHGLEKIKTIGDAYMVAAGMPHLCGDPVHRVAAMALDMLETTKALSEELDEPVEVRIGIHAGPTVAGVIGNRKLFYDVCGETVNTASRMESHGEAGRIQVTEAAKAELEGDYSFEPRGQVEVKGLGKVETWWLMGLAK